MILGIISNYSDIIENYDVIRFKVSGSSYTLICKINLMNHNQLFVRDYLFPDGSRKYSFHWQDRDGKCIVRWDNAPHHQDVPGFPFHKHVGINEDIMESQPMKLDEVLKYIQDTFANE